MRLVVSFLLCGIATCPLSIAAQTSNSTTPLQFVPLPTPCRAVDTRLMGGPIAAETSQNLNPAGEDCNIPSQGSGPIAYAVNVTVVPHGPLGFLTVWPTGESQPVVSTLNSDGRVKANAAIVAGGNGGLISVYASNTTDLVLDVSGYFISSTTDYVYVPIPPCRVVDTRINNGTSFGAPSLVAGQQRAFEIANSSCNLPASLFANGGAVTFNVTVVPTGGDRVSYLTLWGTSPSEPQTPLISTLNATTGTVVANAALTSINPSTSGSISVYATDDADLVLDVSGYFAPASQDPSGMSLYTLPPCRVLDTRESSGEFQGKLKVPVTSGNNCNIPTNGEAYVMNATVVPAGPLGFLTLWPDTTAQPVASALNANDNAVTSNLAIVSSPDGSIDAFASSTTELILDVSGYFAPAPSFTLSTGPPDSITVQPGGIGTFTLTASAVNGFTGPINATLTPTAGLTVSPSTVNLVPGVAQAIAVSATSDAVSGGVSIQANAQGFTQSIQQTVTIGPNFTIGSAPGGQLTDYIEGYFQVAGDPIFYSNVTAQLTGLPPGLLAGQYQYTSSNIPVGPVGSTLTLYANCPGEFIPSQCNGSYWAIVYNGAAAGTYPLTLTATSGSVTHSETATLVVTPPTTNLSVTPASVTIAQGGSQQLTLTFSGYGASHSGTNFLLLGLPSGLSANFSNNGGSAPLVLQASPSATVGTYVVTVACSTPMAVGNAAAPGLTVQASTQFTVTIGPAPALARQTNQ